MFTLSQRSLPTKSTPWSRRNQPLFSPPCFHGCVHAVIIAHGQNNSLGQFSPKLPSCVILKEDGLEKKKTPKTSISSTCLSSSRQREKENETARMNAELIWNRSNLNFWRLAPSAQYEFVKKILIQRSFFFALLLYQNDWKLTQSFSLSCCKWPCFG